MALLIKFWKSPPESKSKKEIKQLAIEKCEAYVPHFKDNKIKRSPEIKKMVESVWKDWNVKGDNPSKLRTINSIGFPREVLDWFLNLEETCVIDDEKKKKMQEMRFPARISNHPMTFTRTKFLFTLFVWACIQSEYANGLYHNIDKSIKKIKEDGNLPASYNVLNERNILEDLGFIRTTDKNVDLLLDFIEKEPVFSIPITKENEVKLEGMDLYECGKWLEKQKYSWFICENCGKEIIDKRKNKGGRPRHYCKKCASELFHGVTMDLNVVKIEDVCEICGEKGFFSKFANRRICCNCQSDLACDRWKRYRDSKKRYAASCETLNPQSLDT